MSADMTKYEPNDKGTIVFRSTTKAIIFALVLVIIGTFWSYQNFRFLLSEEAKSTSSMTLIMEMLLPIRWGPIIMLMGLIGLIFQSRLEITNSEILGRAAGSPLVRIPRENLGWVSLEDADIAIYRGPYLTPRKQRTGAITLFDHDGRQLLLLTKANLAAQTQDIAACLVDRTGAHLGAPPRPIAPPSRAAAVSLTIWSAVATYVLFVALLISLTRHFQLFQNFGR